MIVGHLEEDWNDIMDSLILIGRIETDYPEFGPLTPFPDTEVYARAMREGWIRNQGDWGQFSISNLYRVLRNRNFDYQEILELAYFCNGVARVISEWAKVAHSWAGFFHALAWPADRPWPLLQAKGRFLAMKYLLTKDEKYLRALNLGHSSWRTRLLRNPNLTILSEIKRNPLSLFTTPHKIRVVKLGTSSIASAFRELLASIVMCPVYATILTSISRTTHKRK
jgi:hypothetical protein